MILIIIFIFLLYLLYKKLTKNINENKRFLNYYESQIKKTNLIEVNNKFYNKNRNKKRKDVLGKIIH